MKGAGLSALLQDAAEDPQAGEPPTTCVKVPLLRMLARLLDQRRDASQASTDTVDVEAPLISADRFTPYVPEPPRVLRPSLGKPAKDKFAEMLYRVRQREKDSIKMFRLRGKHKPPASRGRVDTAVL